MSYTTGDDTVSKSEGISQLCGVMDTLDLDAPSQTNGEEESCSGTNTMDYSKIDTSIKYVLEEDDDNDDIAIEESSDDEEEEKQLPPSLLSRYCKWLCPACCMRIPHTWPRTIGIIFGICFPLFGLIGIALFFGYFLAFLEAPDEKVTNNDIISTQEILALQKQLVDEITKKLPSVCSSMFILEQSGELSYDNCIARNFSALNCSEPVDVRRNKWIETHIQSVFVKGSSDKCSNINMTNVTEDRAMNINITEELIKLNVSNISTNGDDLTQYMAQCGSEALDIASQYNFQNVIKPGLAESDLTFNWLQCTAPKSKKNAGTVIKDGFNVLFNASQFRPSIQENIVRTAWEQDQQQLYCQYVEEDLKRNQTLLDSRLNALSNSYIDADGFDDRCYVNTWAGAWFWFTVMTTMGYGNTAPTSDGGRAMIFTLGFFSIVLFAGVLAKAGSIVAAIVDDFVDRSPFECLNRPWIFTIFWGILYYAWMIFIASYYQYWNEERLEDDSIDYADAYWFAYISTTTVGLGDYYLNHAVLIGFDLLVWPLMFLFGFVLLSSFLNKVAEWIYSFLPKNRATFEEKLASENAPLVPRCIKKRIPERYRKKKKKKVETEMQNEEDDSVRATAQDPDQ